MNAKQKVPVTILTGFLGSGKTTLLNRILSEEHGKRIAVIENEYGEVGIDQALVINADEEIFEMSNGCICCTVRGDLIRVLGNLMKRRDKFDYVLVETTGLADPGPVAQTFFMDDEIASEFSLDGIVTLVDAHHINQQLGRSQESTEQIAFASVIMLTKVDAIPKASVDTQVRFLKQLHPNTTIALSAQAGLMLSQLENVPSPDLLNLSKKAEQLDLIQQDSTAENVEATIFSDPRPFHPQRLHEACCNKLGTGLYRTKGFLWLASRPGHVLLWQQSGSQISLELSGLWRAEIAKNLDGKLLPEEVEQLNKRLDKEHSIFGDRHNELTIIGAEADRNGFQLALEDALCTEEEISAWQNGASFTDPWPKTMRHSN